MAAVKGKYPAGPVDFDLDAYTAFEYASTSAFPSDQSRAKTGRRLEATRAECIAEHSIVLQALGAGAERGS